MLFEPRRYYGVFNTLRFANYFRCCKTKIMFLKYIFIKKIIQTYLFICLIGMLIDNMNCCKGDQRNQHARWRSPLLNNIKLESTARCVVRLKCTVTSDFCHIQLLYTSFLLQSSILRCWLESQNLNYPTKPLISSSS